jgi:hypothetical protein
VTGLHDHLAQRDTSTSEEVEVLAVLHQPARVRQLTVDQHPGTPLGRKIARPFTGVPPKKRPHGISSMRR